MTIFLNFLENNKERKVIQVNKILIAVVALVLMATACYAADEAVTQATEPVSKAVEATGVFVGSITSVVTNSVTGGGPSGIITVTDETGKNRIFIVDDTVKIADAALNAVTLNQLKKGEKVAVEYSNAPMGAEKPSSIKVIK